MKPPVLRLLLGTVLAVATFGRPVPAADERPSIVFAIADDWSWPHAGAYGDKAVSTPTFDRVARQGVRFTNAFCTAPSCSPSRASILTGQVPHRLEEGGDLWSLLPRKFPCYTELLERAGYRVGMTGKGWGPGSVPAAGRDRNPAGPGSKGFAEFLERVAPGQPFCFWFGSLDPHRPYEKGSGVRAGLNPDAVTVPPFLPDTPEVRSDLLDYAFEVQRFDRHVGEILKALEAAGRLDNTIVVMTSDNGLPFPRAKANLYDAGTHMPLAISWPARIQGGRTVEAFVTHADFAPTFLEAAGLAPPAGLTGRSLLGLLAGGPAADRDAVFLERERHANVRRGDVGYPCRAIRTRESLYIQNLRPDRWPAGDPQLHHAVGPFGDIDESPSKSLLLDHRDDPAIAPFFRLACGRRPAEELYDLAIDPWQVTNLADDPTHAATKARLRARLDRWRAETADPLLTSGDDDPFDHYPYFGPPARDEPK